MSNRCAFGDLAKKIPNWFDESTGEESVGGVLSGVQAESAIRGG